MEGKKLPQSVLKTNNKKKILKYIFTNGAVSKADLATVLGSTKTTISKNANELIEERFIIETGKGNNQVGKKSTLLDINPDVINFFVINLAGNIFNLSIFNLKNENLYHTEIEIPNKNEIYSILESAIEKTNTHKTLTTCIFTIPAVVYGQTITANNEVYTQAYEKILNFCKDKNIKLIAQNDIDLLAEYFYSCNMEKENFVLIGANYGIGSSIFLRGSLLKGEKNFAGEIGFTNPVYKGGEIQNLEKRCSVSGMITRYYKDTGKKLSIEEFNEEIGKKNEIINSYINEMISEISLAIINMSYMLDVKTIILSGALFELRSGIVDEIIEYIYRLKIEDIKITKASHSTKSIDGAFLIMQRELLKHV